MKNLIAITALIFCCSAAALAQSNSSIGIFASGIDYAGPIDHQYLFHDKATTDANGNPSKKNVLLWRPAARVAYMRRLNKFIDLSAGLTFSNVEMPNSDKDTSYVNRLLYADNKHKELYLGLDVRVQYYILDKTRYFFTPYLLAGISGIYHDDGYGVGYTSAVIPVGAGFNFNLGNDIHLQLESTYKIAGVNKLENNHLQHSIGIVFGLNKPKEKEVVVEEPAVVDTDNDGVPDNVDACPTIAGSAQFNGCPDSDGDGISDKDDACPLVAGLAQFQGCPDSDGDGISDNKDKCPYLAGSAQYDGCPPPDRDHDGVMDNEDNCPDVAGTAANHGCPEIRREVITKVEAAAKAIFFETGKSAIKKVSFKSLDIVVGIMKEDPSLYADIEGHTDNVKPKTYTNMELSQSRAQSVVDYFVAHGISADRLTAHGYGDTQPVADNATAAGRAQNRRTVIKLRNFK